MNKLLVLAALGSVEACPFQDYYNEMRKKCPESDAPKLNEIQQNRLFFKNTYQGFVTGLYSENSEVVPDECFGAWVESPIHKIKDLHKKAHDDFWSIGIDEVKDAGSELIDVFYQNAEVCHFKRVQDDLKGWCIENPGECIFQENLEARVFDNMFDIMGKLFDIYKLSNTDDTCYSDLEYMAELHRFSNDLGELAASLSGFDYKWDQSIERKHIKKRAFHSQIKDLYQNYQYKNVDPLELMFPDVYEFFKGLEHQMVEFLKEMEESQKQFAKALTPAPVTFHTNGHDFIQPHHANKHHQRHHHH